LNLTKRIVKVLCKRLVIEAEQCERAGLFSLCPSRTRPERATQRPPDFHSRRIGIQPATDDIQQITPVAQRNGQQMGEV
jgi:hypothetical protein